MKKIRKTVMGVTPPIEQNVVWIDMSGNAPVQKVFNNGKWEPTSADTEDYYTKGEIDKNFMRLAKDVTTGNILMSDSNGQAVSSGKYVTDFIANPSTTGQEGEVLSVDSEGNPVWTTITPTGTADTEMSDSSTNAVQNKIIKSYVDDNYAKKDGYYSQMTVGSAENLISQTVDSEAYLIRPTAGAENEVANGIAYVEGMEGNSCVWNQIVQNGNFVSTSNWSAEAGVTFTVANNVASITRNSGSNNGINQGINIKANHKYFVHATARCENTINVRLTAGSGQLQNPTTQLTGNVWTDISYISTPTQDRDTFYIYQASGNATTFNITNIMVFDLTLLGINNLTEVSKVEEWLAQHVGTKPYYAYNAGTILSAQTLGIKTYGQNLLNPTTKQAKLIPYTWVENGITYSNQYTIKNIPSGATATFTPDNTGVAETVDISGGSLDITSYGSGILELSSATANTYVCMKWNTEKDNDVVSYEDHTYNFDVRNIYGKVNGEGEYIQCFPNGMRSAGDVHDTLTASEAVVRIGSRAYQSGDESDSTIITDGTNTLYALTTPVTYTDLIYRNGGIDRPLADVLMNIEVNNWSMEEQLMTDYNNGNPTSIPATISTKYGMDAVEQIDTLNKTCYFADDVKANLQAMLTCINTNCAETLGGTFSIGDPTQEDSKVFTFTFTANTEPDVEQTNE